MNTKKTVLVLMAITASLCLAFFEGVKYQKNSTLSDSAQKEQAQADLRAKMAIAKSTQKGGEIGYVSGEIASSTKKSLNIKLPNGENRVIFIEAETAIMRNTSGEIGDLAVGALVSVGGSANPDGSMNAQSVNVRTEK